MNNLQSSQKGFSSSEQPLKAKKGWLKILVFNFNLQNVDAVVTQVDITSKAVCMTFIADFQVTIFTDSVRGFVDVFPAQHAALRFRQFLK